MDQGHYKRAIDYNQKGVEYFLSKPDSALFYFDKAIQEDSTFQPAIQNKVNYYIKYKKNYPEALKSLNKLIAIKPYPEALLFQGLLLDKMGSHDEAVDSYKKSLKGYEKQDNRIGDIGVVQLLLGDTTNAKLSLIKYKEEGKGIKQLTDSILNNLNNREKVIDDLLN